MSLIWEPGLGAVVLGDGVRFTVWAPQAREVVLHLERGTMPNRVLMSRNEDGYWTATLALRDAPPGLRYGYLLDGEGPFPDPCSRSQPAGTHALSAVIDPGAFTWDDADFEPPAMADLVIYEMHTGTFTAAGTFDAAIEHLPALRELGVRAVEVMPVAEFAGARNWGYDGVALFAPESVYGGPDALRRFAAAAHRAGLAVILDVVYNHFGPDGSYAGVYSSSFFDRAESTPWGAAISFADEHVRRFYTENLLHWVHEYHIDGFRFDAASRIIDRSPEHILAAISREAAAHPRGGRAPYLIAETNEDDSRYFRPSADGGLGFDAVWADDFHHIMRVLLAGDRDGYFHDYEGTAEELATAITQGFLARTGAGPGGAATREGAAPSVPWSSFVYCIQNHDQVGNRALGDRLSTTASHADLRVGTLLLLLLPQVPLLFQGQEYFAQTPFQYFTDHEPALGALVTEGRRNEFGRFGAFASPELRDAIPDPQAEATFRRSVLNRDEAAAGVGRLARDFHRALLDLRATDPVLADYRRERLTLNVEAAARALLVRFESSSGRRLLVFNLGEAVSMRIGAASAPHLVLATDEPRFGGNGVMPLIANGRIELPRHSGAFFLA